MTKQQILDANDAAIRNAANQGITGAVEADALKRTLDYVDQEIATVGTSPNPTDLSSVADTASRSAVEVVTSLPGSGNIGKVIYLNANVSTPDVPFALAFKNPGYYIRSITNKWTPLTSARQLGLSAYWVGDSWIYATSQTDFAAATSSVLGWTHYNQGVPGTTIISTGNLSASKGGGFVGNWFGTNDIRAYGLTCIPQYMRVMLYNIITELTDLQYAATTATSTSNTAWSSISFGSQNNRAAQSTTLNSSPLAFTVTGPVIYVGMAHTMGSNNNYTISIDGQVVATNSSNIEVYSPNAGTEVGNGYRFEVSSGSHLVEITPVSGTDPTKVVYVSSNKKPRPELTAFDGQATEYAIFSVPHTADTTTPAPTVTVTDTTRDNFNLAQKIWVDRLRRDGHSVRWVDVNKWFDAKKSTNMDNTGFHLAFDGAQQMATGLIIDLFPGSTQKEVPYQLYKLTTTLRDYIVGWVEGNEIYNLTTHTKQYYNGTVWKNITTD